MSPESKLLFQSIRERDKALTEQERGLLQSLLSGAPLTGLASTGQPPDNLMPLAAVATRLAVSEATVRRLEDDAELAPLYITPDLPRYDPKEVEQFVARRRAIRDQAQMKGPQRRPIKYAAPVSLCHGT